MHKVVVDANVWISALLDGKNALSIVDKLEHSQFQLVFAEPLITELTDVLSRPKFAKILAERSEQLFALIREKAILIKLGNIPKVSRDPKDDVYLACAVAAQADFLVSGDDDLLALKDHGNTRIVTPKQFLETFTR